MTHGFTVCSSRANSNLVPPLCPPMQGEVRESTREDTATARDLWTRLDEIDEIGQKSAGSSVPLELGGESRWVRSTTQRFTASRGELRSRLALFCARTGRIGRALLRLCLP